jgi:apolipoprotein N-acyltransferase
MWEKLLRNPFALAVAAGASVFLAFPRFEIYPLILLFPGLSLLLVRQCSSTKAAFWYGFLVSFVIMLGGFYWVTYVIHEFGYLPWGVAALIFLGFCGFGALNFPLFSAITFYTERTLNVGRLPRPWLELWYAVGLPALFTLIEWLVPKLFPWFLAHSLYRAIWLTQISEITGAIFLTFAMFSLGSVASLYFIQNRSKLPTPHPAIWAFPVLLWAVIGAFSATRLAHPLPERVMNIALIQANIGSLEKVAARQGFTDKVRHVMQTYERLTDDAMQGTPRPDLIVWPETAMPFTLQNEGNTYARELRGKVLQWNVPLVTGGYAISPFDFSRDYNSAYLLEPMGGDKIHQEMYHKNILLAYGEYMPGGETFPILYKWFPQVSNFERGKLQNAFTLKDGTRLGVTICYEAIVPSFFRKVARNEVNLVLNLTNDSWFGPTSEPYLHGALTIFRSIESRLPFARVTNTGTSFTVDVFGRMSKETGVYSEGVLVSGVRVPASPPLTFYTRYGDWFIGLIAIVEIAFLVFLYRRRNAPVPI